jgi:site-specific DNA-cytosine methylase
MKKLKVISLFDGMSCGRIALDRVGIPVDSYHASEIEKYPIKVSEFNYPDIVHIGDVCDVDPDDYGDFDLIIGGSPCQSLSVAGTKGGIKTNDGKIVDSLEKYMFMKEMGYTYNKKTSKYFTTSSLFWEFVRIYRGIKVHNPDVKFLLENVVNDKWEPLITRELGVNAIHINSSMVSAQNRDRHYWTNITVEPLKYNGYNLGEIIPGAVSGAGSRGVPQKDWVYSPENPKKHKAKLTVRKDGLANCLTASGGKACRRYQDIDGDIQDITVSNAEQLQTVPVGYTRVPGVSDAQRFKMLGNGWTVDVISHIFKNLKQDTNPFSRVVEMAKETPNDFELGGKVRRFVNETSTVKN